MQFAPLAEAAAEAEAESQADRLSQRQGRPRPDVGAMLIDYLHLKDVHHA